MDQTKHFLCQRYVSAGRWSRVTAGLAIALNSATRMPVVRASRSCAGPPDPASYARVMGGRTAWGDLRRLWAFASAGRKQDHSKNPWRADRRVRRGDDCGRGRRSQSQQPLQQPGANTTRSGSLAVSLALSDVSQLPRAEGSRITKPPTRCSSSKRVQ